MRFIMRNDVRNDQAVLRSLMGLCMVGSLALVACDKSQDDAVDAVASASSAVSYVTGDIDISNPGHGLKASVGDGKTDNTKAINDALVYARKNKLNVYVPSGTFAHQGIAIVGKVALYGSGAASVLKNIAPLSDWGDGYVTQEEGAIWLTDEYSVDNKGATNGIISDSPRLVDVKILWNDKISRGGVSVIEVWGPVGYPVSNFVISGVIEGDRASNAIGSGGAGIYIENGAKGSVFNNQIYRSMADGIHMTGRSNNIQVYGNTLEQVGDDMIAVVSYATDGAVSHDISVHDNHGISQTNGRGLTVVGGDKINITNNRLDSTWGGGIYLTSEESYNTYAPTNIVISGNTVNNANQSTDVVHGGAFIEGRSGYVASNIQVTGNTINDRPRLGIVTSSYTSNISVSGNSVNGTGTITPSAPTAPGASGGSLVTVDDNAFGWTYSGWATYSDSNCQGGTAHGGQTKGNYAQYTFTGTAVNLYAWKGPDGGSVQVFIDGVSQGTFSQVNASDVHKQNIFSKKWSAGGTHTIKVQSANTSWTMIDYITYQP